MELKEKVVEVAEGTEEVKEEKRIVLPEDIKEKKVQVNGKNKKDTPEEVWRTDFWKETYGKVVNGVKVYAVHPIDAVEGAILKLRSKEELTTLDKADAIPCQWMEEISDILNNEVAKDGEYKLIVTKEIRKNIENNFDAIAKIDLEPYGYVEGTVIHLSLAFFDLVSKPQVEEKAEEPVYSIVRDIDEDIIAEMKSKVDRKRFQTLLSVSASKSSRKVWVKDEIVDKYLDIWAHNKYPYYLLFGRNLSIEKEVELEKNEKEMENSVGTLIAQYPQYGLYLREVRSREYIKNELETCHDYASYYGRQFYQKGMKVSKFFNEFFNHDEKFNIELSKIMQDKFVKGILSVSIDPYDYLTSSINKANWTSCHSIGGNGNDGGIHANGCLSYLLDNATLVSHRYDGRNDYKYNSFNFNFEGNSKLHRMLIYFDPNSCNFICSRQYPNHDEKLSTIVRNMLQAQVAMYTGCSTEWEKCRDNFEGKYEDKSRLHYSDVLQYSDSQYTWTKPCGSRQGAGHITVGYKAPCLICGKEITNPEKIGLCNSCR